MNRDAVVGYLSIFNSKLNLCNFSYLVILSVTNYRSGRSFKIQFSTNTELLVKTQRLTQSSRSPAQLYKKPSWVFSWVNPWRFCLELHSRSFSKFFKSKEPSKEPLFMLILLIYLLLIDIHLITFHKFTDELYLNSSPSSAVIQDLTVRDGNEQLLMIHPPASATQSLF